MRFFINVVLPVLLMLGAIDAFFIYKAMQTHPGQQQESQSYQIGRDYEASALDQYKNQKSKGWKYSLKVNDGHNFQVVKGYPSNAFVIFESSDIPENAIIKLKVLQPVTDAFDMIYDMQNGKSMEVEIKRPGDWVFSVKVELEGEIYYFESKHFFSPVVKR